MNVAVVFAGGTGVRMQSGATPKQFLQIHGKTVLEHTLENFETHPEVDAIAVACLPLWIPFVRSRLSLFGLSKVRWVVNGGGTTQESVFNALQAICADGGPGPDSLVLVHDGVRPLINPTVITENIVVARECGGAVTASMAWETVATVDATGAIESINDRSVTCVAKAPQTFRFHDLYAAHLAARERGGKSYVDSASLMMDAGHRPRVVQGPPENIKVTTGVDFYMLRAILDAREAEAAFGIAAG